MTTLELVPEPPPRLSGLPEWIERSLNVKAGRDPLGLQTITLDRIMPILLPGILVLSQRARYFTLFSFLLALYEELRLPPTNEDLSHFIKLREFEYAVAVQLCPRGCGQTSAGAVGKDRAGPAAAAETDTIERQESVQSFLGGYGLYYRTPLVELGLVVPKGTVVGEEVTPVDVLGRDERAQALSTAFGDAIADTAYRREHMLGTEPIPRSVLEEFAGRACLCRLSDYPDEQWALRRALFEAPAPALELEFDQRRRSFALFLREVERHPTVAGADSDFRAAVWEDFVGADGAAEPPLRTTVAQWAALAMKEHLQEGFSAIWSQFCHLGLAAQAGDGLTPAELNDLIRGPLLGRGPQDVLGRSLAYDAAVPAVEFAAAVARETADIPPENLRAWAVEEESGASGLILLLATVGRLPKRGGAPPAWSEVGLQHSERQPSLLGFAMLVEQQFEAAPSLGDFFAWIVRRFVVSAHEQIAYSKLPDFTFRFRWEGGRLRFYPIGLWRFDLADMRRQSMARLSEDVGLWADTEDVPQLTEEGRAFVGEVFE
jgi:hypothetical protein